MPYKIDEDPRGNGFLNPDSLSDSSFEEDERDVADRLAVERIIDPDRFVGRPQRWYLGSTFHATPDQKFYHRLSNLQRNALNACQGKRLSWELVVGALSKFFPVSTIDNAVKILLSIDGKMPHQEELVVHILGAIECILRLRHILIPHSTIEDINRYLDLKITKGDVSKIRFQLCQKLPHLRVPNPHKSTNFIMRRIASDIIVKHMLNPYEKKWAVQNTIALAQSMLDDQFYPSCPEIYGNALALLVINTLRKFKDLPRCRIPSQDPDFRKKVSMAMLRLKKRFDLNNIIDNMS
ncbi:MAG: hypothetical protein ACFFCZ_09730 [Promethearchaeota archaeon]